MRGDGSGSVSLQLVAKVVRGSIGAVGPFKSRRVPGGFAALGRGLWGGRPREALARA